MSESQPFNKLFGITGGLILVIGLALVGLFMQHALTGDSSVPTNGVGHYFIAFTGSAMAAWGTILLRASRDTTLAAAIAVPTALGFGLMSAYRAVVTFTEAEVMDWVGYVPAGEAVVFAIVAVVFLLRR